MLCDMEPRNGHANIACQGGITNAPTAAGKKPPPDVSTDRTLGRIMPDLYLQKRIEFR